MQRITRDSLDWEIQNVWDAYFEDGKKEVIREFYIETVKKLKESNIPVEAI